MRSFCLKIALGLSLISCSNKPEEELSKSFFALMGFDKSVWKFVATDREYDSLQYFQALYARNKEVLFDETGENRIPKVIHFIWLGSRPFPEDSVANVVSWIKRHPHWKVQLWTDRPRPLPHPSMEVRFVEDFEFLQLRSFFDKSKNTGEQSSLLRYEILYQEGGVAVDHDVECFNAFDPFQRLDFYCGLAPPSCSTLSSAISICQSVVAARPQHPILGKSIELITRYWDDVTDRCGGNSWESIMHRVNGRTTLRFAEAIELVGAKQKDKNIIFPAGFFNKIDGDFGLYAHHKHQVTWLNYETRFERDTRRELDYLKRKNTSIFALTLILFVLVVCLGGISFRCYRLLQRAVKDQERP